MTLTERIHQLLELRRTLNLEEYFVVVIGHFNIEVLNGSRRISSRESGVGHFETERTKSICDERQVGGVLLCFKWNVSSGAVVLSQQVGGKARVDRYSKNLRRCDQGLGDDEKTPDDRKGSAEEKMEGAEEANG